MNSRLLEIKTHCNRRLFKFDVNETDSDVVISNVWVKDYKPSVASYDGLRALKYYAHQRNKDLHVVSKTSKVFNLLSKDGFHQNLLMSGKGDISSMLGDSIFMYTWRK